MSCWVHSIARQTIPHPQNVFTAVNPSDLLPTELLSSSGDDWMADTASYRPRSSAVGHNSPEMGRFIVVCSL
jgi:hypothetical protein